MKKETSTPILVKAVFTGNKSVEQVFIDLLREKIVGNLQKGAAFSSKMCYNEGVVFPDVHA